MMMVKHGDDEEKEEERKEREDKIKLPRMHDVYGCLQSKQHRKSQSQSSCLKLVADTRPATRNSQAEIRSPPY